MGEGELVDRQVLSLAMVRRVAAMLDLDPFTFADGDALPRNWHFPLLAAQTRRRELRADGFPGLGVPMPDLGLPRLLLIGRTLDVNRDLPIGAVVERRSAIRSLDQKDDERGRRAIVTVAHELRVAGDPEPAVVETQTYLLMPNARYEPVAVEPVVIVEEVAKDVSIDATLLFQYSALGFNSHRIHLDRAHARAEGFPDLVVNGGLIALLLTELARRDLGLTLASLRIKHIAPLFADRLATLVARQDDGGWTLRARGDHGMIAAEMKVMPT